MDYSWLKDALFYAVAVAMVAGAALTVFVRNVLHSAVALIGTFFGTAVLYFLLSAEFIAVAQVMVYIGGVMVFIVFAILLTSHLGEKNLRTSLARKIAAAVLSLVFVASAVVLLRNSGVSSLTETDNFASLSSIGTRLLSPEQDGFLLPFEAISLLLLISLIGAASIARIPEEDLPYAERTAENTTEKTEEK
ncbi:NADH-quinone oxidoreductase subunit J [Fibrobacterales bacterium]|nr:NADH-quinone oxidoreductase subunit J [Fibrobacterales bacterium]